MTNRIIASDELEPPNDADKGATYGPVPSANTAIEDQDNYPTVEYGEVPNVPTTNTKGYFPYRGSEQHGVRFTHDTKSPIPAQSHYAAEQLAFENYIDPKITPRDISPVAPIRVTVIPRPNVLKQSIASIRTVPVTASSGIVLLVPQDWNRTRLVVQVSANVASVIGWFKTKNDANKTFDAMKVIAANTGQPITLLDTTATSPFYFAVDDTQASTDTITVTLYWERPVYDGENLLNG